MDPHWYGRPVPVVGMRPMKIDSSPYENRPPAVPTPAPLSSAYGGPAPTGHYPYDASHLPSQFYQSQPAPRTPRSNSSNFRRAGQYAAPTIPYSEVRGSVKISVTPYTTLSLTQPTSPKLALSRTLTQRAIFNGEFVKNPNSEKLHRSLTHKENVERQSARRLRSGSTGALVGQRVNPREREMMSKIITQQYHNAMDLPMPTLFTR